MSFSTEFHADKQSIFLKGDKECEEHASLLRDIGDVFVDPDFPPTANSLGKIIDDQGNEDFENLNDPWFAPHQFQGYAGFPDYGRWSLYEDPWPFHVDQGRLGDCWLIAAIQAIARRKEIVEQILPEREYTRDCGIVPVRLFVNGKWEVIRVDYHIPQDDGMTRGAKILKNQFWVAFIEKAFAKVRGSYGDLIGGTTCAAFQCLTGCYSTSIHLNPNADAEKMWEDLISYYSCGYPLAAATPKAENYRKIGLCPEHGYSILDFKEHEGHRLIQIGSTNSLRWNGKWSHLSGYDYDTFRQFPFVDRRLIGYKIFWIEIDDFIKYFDTIYVCKYKSGWHDRSVTQTIKRKSESNSEAQIMKIQIEKRQEFVIDVKLRKEQCGLYLQFLNIHKATAENECGELVYNFNTYACQITSDSFFLDPGTYFINFLDVVSLHHPLVTVDWVIRSPSPLTTVSMDFVIIPFKTAIQSVQEVVLKYGKSEKYENGNLIVYTYTNANCFLIMADNLYKWTHIRYNATLLSDKEGVYSGSMLKQTSWVPISPRTRSFVAFLNHIELGVPTSQIKLEYCLSSWFMKWLNWIDASIFSENFELAISI